MRHTKKKVHIGGVNIPAPSNSSEQAKAEKITIKGGMEQVKAFMQPEVKKISTYIVWNNFTSARERVLSFYQDNAEIIHLFKRKAIAQVLQVSEQHLSKILSENNLNQF